MKKEKGVVLWLIPGTRVPFFVRVQTKNVTVKTQIRNDRRVRVLQIKGGDAAFAPGGSVEVRVPGAHEATVAFGPGTVLAICEMNRKIRKANYILCQNCRTWGTELSRRDGDLLGRYHLELYCKNCENKWEVYNV